MGDPPMVRPRRFRFEVGAAFVLPLLMLAFIVISVPGSVFRDYKTAEREVRASVSASQMLRFGAVLETFKSDYGRYPHSRDGALAEPVSDYLSADQLGNRANGKPYRYDATGSVVRTPLVSDPTTYRSAALRAFTKADGKPCGETCEHIAFDLEHGVFGS